MENFCANVVSRACHEYIWGEWGTTLELSLSLWEIFQIVIAIIFVLVIKNYLADPIRSDVFWGYVPTLVIAVKDRTTGKLIIVCRSYFEQEDQKKSPVWRLPQGIMETTYIGEEARRILKTELNLEEHQFRFTGRDLSLKRLKIKRLQKAIPEKLGFSLFKNGRGRVYKVVEVETDVKQKGGSLSVFGGKLQSMGAEDLLLASPDQAMKLIEKTYKKYARRKDKIAVYREILKKLGYLEVE